jgi:hypothetical protein
MSGLSPLTMLQGNSRELMIESNRSGKSTKLAKPKFAGKKDQSPLWSEGEADPVSSHPLFLHDQALLFNP